MIYTKNNLELINEITNFLKEKDRNYNLWHWALAVPLEERLDQLFNKNIFLLRALENEEKIVENGSVLDLGCGFCPYWPFLNRLGYNKFVGYDLYSKRGYGEQEYMSTAKLLVEKFCKNCEFIIIEDDVRNISNFQSDKVSHVASENFKTIKNNSFDLIFTKNTNYKKVGSTGIPEDIFDNICKDYLKKDGIRMYAG